VPHPPGRQLGWPWMIGGRLGEEAVEHPRLGCFSSPVPPTMISVPDESNQTGHETPRGAEAAGHSCQDGLVDVAYPVLLPPPPA
jgi:hypothetical protein